MSSIASVVTHTVTTTVTSASASSTLRAAPQGGVLDGLDPTTYNSSNPIILFIIQAGIIIIFCRILHWPLSKIRQPRVIAEVIGGIILGPSVMMRIPGFKAAIFPTSSMPILSLVANLGLILFLFLVALEVDMRMFLRNWRVALSVGLAGMILPFGLGCAIAYGLYHQFRTDSGLVPISFGVYALFIGTALSITAFPVLCRILTDLKLLGTPVGVTVLAAGVGNDVTGWILLALCVALVNQGSGLTALWVLLCCVGWVLFLVYAIRPCFLYMLRRTGSIQNGPTQTMVAVTLLLTLTSAWFTGIIGVHPIFGGFLVGLICPHDGGFAIKLTEKIEDLVTVLFLPLYFALSGLSTDLGLLNDGITWAYVIGVIAVAFGGKIIGGTLAARGNKLVWRESLTIGVLMSCKGLVELIVLNIGLQAKILSTRTFTIFVVMALVTTVATTPLTSFLYPPWYQKKLDAWKRGDIDWDGNALVTDDSNRESVEKLQNTQVRRLLVYLRLESLPSLFTFIALMGGDASITAKKVHKSKNELASVQEGQEASSEGSSIIPKRPLEVHGVRIVELTERTSSVMKVSEVDEYTNRDAVVNTFKTFAQLNNVAVSGGVSVVPESSYAETLMSQASDLHSDLVLIPWSETGSMSEGDQDHFLNNYDRFSSGTHSAFIAEALQTATCNTAVFVNRGFGGPARQEVRPLKRTVSGLSLRSHREAPTAPIADRSHHVYFPFFGGADDRVALRFVLQLAQNSNITVTVIHFNYLAHAASAFSKAPEVMQESVTGISSRPETSQRQFPEPLDAETLTAAAEKDAALLHTLRDSLPLELTTRVVFADYKTTNPLADCLEHAKQELGQSPKNAGDLVVLGRGRHAQLVDDSSTSELGKTLGVVAESLISGGARGSILVMQAGGRGLEV
ncbi:putative K(+) antiporter 1 [Coleophoma crateriformis]|uniref:Putative K(+) antiporter 1 n=1 Tax=Coleophoma crateriformis TaxID=565419 RepID=A0A3D8RD82_9HELO|nr:putative K(+) antiporter 1 [Coleophoma crateriformis]